MPRKWWYRYAPVPARGPAGTLKRFIWLYVLLWLFEGVFRKWIFPTYAPQLLLIRDPVALTIVLYAVFHRLWKLDVWTMVLWAMGFTSFLITLGLGVPVAVDIVGLRTLCLHLPLIFIVGQNLTRADIEQIGNIVLDLSLPIGLLMALQFSSSPDAFINAGAGLDVTQLQAVEGKIRAPGVFSYISGAAQFYSWVAAFLLNKIASSEKSSYLTLSLSGIGLVLAASMAISRTLSASVAIVAFVFAIATFVVGLRVSRLIYAFGVFVLIGLVVSQSRVIDEGISAFVERWLQASDYEGSFFTRVFSSVSLSWNTIVSAGIWGHGLGVGTNMGAKLMTGEVGFQLAESEWERIVLEMGAPLGIAFIVWRVTLLASISKKCFRAMVRKDVLPVLLLGAGGLSLLNGQTGVPATLGFVALSSGFALAAAESGQVFAIRDGLLQLRNERYKFQQARLIQRHHRSEA